MLTIQFTYAKALDLYHVDVGFHDFSWSFNSYFMRQRTCAMMVNSYNFHTEAFLLCTDDFNINLFNNGTMFIILTQCINA